MGMINGIRTLNALCSGTMTGAQLTTYLATGSNSGSFQQLLTLRGQAKVLAESSVAMTAVIASSTAMTAVAASSTAMTAVWASNTAADAVMTSSAAKLAVYNNDTALAALQFNPVQVARQISISGRTTTFTTSTSTVVAKPNGTKVILLRFWSSSNEASSINFARGYTGAKNSTTAGVILPITSENLGASAAALGHTTIYGNSGTYPSASNDNANIVSAANGLEINTWIVGSARNYIYIAV